MKRKLSLILTLTISLFVLVGCNTPSPTKVVDEYFREVSRGSNSTFIQEMISDTSQTGEMEKAEEDAINTVLSKLEAVVTNETVDGDNATVTLTVKGVSFKSVLENYLVKMFQLAFTAYNLPEEEQDKLILEALYDCMNNALVEERSAKVNLTKINKEWVITEDEDFNYALLGITNDELDNIMSE